MHAGAMGCKQIHNLVESSPENLIQVQRLAYSGGNSIQSSQLPVSLKYMLLQFLAFDYIAGDTHQGDDFVVLPISGAGNFNESGFATLVHDSQFVRLHIVT